MRVLVVGIAGLLTLVALECPVAALRQVHLTAEMVTQIRNRWPSLKQHTFDPKKRGRAQKIMGLAQRFPQGGMIPEFTMAHVRWFLTHDEAGLVKGTRLLSAEQMKTLASEVEHLNKALLNPETRGASQQLISLIQEYPEGGMVPEHARERALWFLNYRDAALVTGTEHLTKENVIALADQMERLKQGLLDPETRDASGQLIDLTKKYPEGGMVPAGASLRVLWFLEYGDAALVKGTEHFTKQNVTALADQVERLTEGLESAQTHDVSRELLDLIQKHPEGGMVPTDTYRRARWFLNHKEAALGKGTRYLTKENVTALVAQMERLKLGLDDSQTHDMSQKLLDLIQTHPQGGMVPIDTYRRVRWFLKHGDAALVKATIYLSQNKVRALERQIQRLEEGLKNPRTQEASRLLIDLITKHPRGGMLSRSLHDRAVRFLKKENAPLLTETSLVGNVLENISSK